MSKIRVLSEETIDKIAAGEVVERPASIVKELVENSIDAGADAITVEIKEGGISFIRITDNGSGIAREDIPTAFLRHATSKITDADDLMTVKSLGFRGEALSSICAVSQVELMTKTSDSLMGTRYVIEGAKEIELTDMGVPGGTTIIVKNIFFNTPVRRKFLKSSITEGSYVAEVCERLALSRPDISIKFINNGQVKFHTSGSGDMKELIYRIYGKDIASEIIPIDYEGKELSIKGFLGKPILNRSTRNYENYFVNGRYIKSDVVAHAVEDGYKEYLMQHKFPFFIMDIAIDSMMVDVNVHPTKMEVRFSKTDLVADIIASAVSSTLKVHEMIPDSIINEPEKEETASIPKAPEPFEAIRIEKEAVDVKEVKQPIEPEQKTADVEALKNIISKAVNPGTDTPVYPANNVVKASQAVMVDTAVQMNFFEDKMLSYDAMDEYTIIGQVFDSFWIIQYKEKLLFLDQHAAHEKVKYEALVKKLNEKTEIATQAINPPIVINLTPSEMANILEYRDNFKSIGFEIEEFGGMDISLRSVPMDLYGREPKEMFLEILDELSDGGIRGVPEVINSKLASMACKSAVKANNSMTKDEVWELLKELMTLENPYNCPHGRPTIFTMSKYELEKKFKRIV